MIFQAIGKKESDMEALTFAMVTSYADQSMHESVLEHVWELLWMTIKTLIIISNSTPARSRQTRTFDN